jgi:membrane-associated phospholipid phosphatase
LTSRLRPLAALSVVALLPVWAQAEQPILRPFAEAADQVQPIDFAPRVDADGFGHGLDQPRDDGRRTLGRFGANLGRNLIGVVSRDNLAPLLAGAALAGAGSFADASTQRYFGSRRRFAALGNFGQQLGEPRNLVPLTAALFVAGRASGDTRFRAATYDAAQAFIVNVAWTGALKYATQRGRPDGSSRLSFPSGHTSNAFAWATIADHHYGHKVGLPALALASLVGVSRLEKNAHHLSDVIAGAALGYVTGRTVARRDGERPARASRFSLAPAAPASGAGLGVAFSYQF